MLTSPTVVCSRDRLGDGIFDLLSASLCGTMEKHCGFTGCMREQSIISIACVPTYLWFRFLDSAGIVHCSILSWFCYPTSNCRRLHYPHARMNSACAYTLFIRDPRMRYSYAIYVCNWLWLRTKIAATECYRMAEYVSRLSSNKVYAAHLPESKQPHT